MVRRLEKKKRKGRLVRVIGDEGWEMAAGVSKEVIWSGGVMVGRRHGLLWCYDVGGVREL